MRKAKVIVLAGQSNAVGVAHTEYLPRHFDEKTVEQLKNGYDKVLMNYFSHDIKSDGFVKTAVGCSEANKDTFGPEVGIAQALCDKYPDEEFFIVKCAFGGTNLFHDWLPPSCMGDYDEFARAEGDPQGEHYRTAGWCFNELVSIMNKSIAALENMDYLPEIIAFCWMQGESDADTSEHVSGYKMRYEAMLSDFAELFGKHSSNCVYVDGGISEVWPLYRELNEVKKEFASQAGNRFYIDTIASGISTLKEPENEIDYWHYDSDCTVKLGNLFAEHIKLN